MPAGNRPSLTSLPTSTMTVTRRRIMSTLSSIPSQQILDSVLWEDGFCCMIRLISNLQYKNPWNGSRFRLKALFDQAQFMGQTSPFGGPLSAKSVATIHGSGQEHS